MATVCRHSVYVAIQCVYRSGPAGPIASVFYTALHWTVDTGQWTLDSLQWTLYRVHTTQYTLTALLIVKFLWLRIYYTCDNNIYFKKCMIFKLVWFEDKAFSFSSLHQHFKKHRKLLFDTPVTACFFVSLISNIEQSYRS